MNKKVVFLSIIMLIAFHSDLYAGEARFVLRENKYPSLCKALNDILNSPDNKPFSTYTSAENTNSNFVITKEYSDKIVQPDWIDIKLDDLKTSGINLPDKVISAIENHFSKTGNYKFQKTASPFDFNNESQETGVNDLYRYQLGNSNDWHCVVSTEPPYQTKFNSSQLTNKCTALSYKGLSFIAYIVRMKERNIMNIDTVNAFISKKRKSISDYMTLGMHRECSFSENK